MSKPDERPLFGIAEQTRWIEAMEASVARDEERILERRLIIGKAKAHLKKTVDDEIASAIRSGAQP